MHHIAKGLGKLVLSALEQKAEKSIQHKVEELKHSLSHIGDSETKEHHTVKSGSNTESKKGNQAKLIKDKKEEPHSEKPLQAKIESKKDKDNKSCCYQNLSKGYTLLNNKTNLTAYNIFKEALKPQILPKIKQKLNCAQLFLLRIWIRKGLNCFYYWLQVEVKEIGNEHKCTVLILEKDDNLELLDILEGHQWIH